MGQLPTHPALVHLPIALALVMPLLTSGLLALWWRGVLPRKAWLIAIAMQALLVVGGMASLSTGERDEERVEALVPEAAIEAHEDAAKVFVAAGAATLLMAIGAAAIRGERGARIAAGAATAMTVVVLGLGYRVGEAGGRLVYEHGAARAFTDAPAAVVQVSSADDE